MAIVECKNLTELSVFAHVYDNSQGAMDPMVFAELSTITRLKKFWIGELLLHIFIGV